MHCSPCARYYLEQAKHRKISKDELSEVLAKVMAVAAGQKRLQTKEVVDANEIALDLYS